MACYVSRYDFGHSAARRLPIDSYLTDPSNVQCNGQRTETDLVNGGMATFIVHGKQKGAIATVQVRRVNNEVSVRTGGDVTGPPQQVQPDGFTPPTPVVSGAELSAFAAGGAWVIDARDNTVVIQGSCTGQ